MPDGLLKSGSAASLQTPKLHLPLQEGSNSCWENIPLVPAAPQKLGCQPAAPRNQNPRRMRKSSEYLLQQFSSGEEEAAAFLPSTLSCTSCTVLEKHLLVAGGSYPESIAQQPVLRKVAPCPPNTSRRRAVCRQGRSHGGFPSRSKLAVGRSNLRSTMRSPGPSPPAATKLLSCERDW